MNTQTDRTEELATREAMIVVRRIAGQIGREDGDVGLKFIAILKEAMQETNWPANTCSNALYDAAFAHVKTLPEFNGKKPKPNRGIASHREKS